MLEISETPQSFDEADEGRKVNVQVTGVTTNSGISNVIEIRKFSRLGKLLTVTFWVKHFLFIRDLQQRAPSIARLRKQPSFFALGLHAKRHSGRERRRTAVFAGYTEQRKGMLSGSEQWQRQSECG